MGIFVLRVEREKQNREEEKKLLGEGKRGVGLLFWWACLGGVALVFPNTECACGLLNACTVVH